MSTSATNWNTAADGSGSRVAWTAGSDAVFSAAGTSAVTLSSSVSANSLTVSAAGYTLSGSTLLLAATSSISAGLTLSHVDLQNSGTLNWTGGNFALTSSSDFTNSGTVNINGTSSTLSQSGNWFGGGGTIHWTSGTVNFSNLTVFSGSTVLDGGAYTFTANSNSEFDAYDLTWTSGTVSINDLLKEQNNTLTLDGGADTFAITGTFQYQSGAVAWTSGNLDLTSATLTGTSSSLDLTVPADSTLTITGTFALSNATLTNNGTINWNATTTTELANITNDGVIILDGSNPLISLTGSSTATEGSPYTLILGSVSSDIPGTVTDYIVDWGDGIGQDDFTTAGAQTYTYAGSPTDPTPYTIQVHLVTATGAYVTAATKTISVTDIAPILTSDDPGTTNTTPTLTGTAGITPGDDSTITLNLYTGSSATGTPVLTVPVDVDPDTGTFSYTIDPASPLAAGTYTYQTTQTETAGNTGTSPAQTFTVDLQSPSPVTNFTATPASPSEIDLTWDAASAADFDTGLSIYISADDGATFTDYADLAGTASTTAITGLDPLAPYLFQIVAHNDTGDSDAETLPPTWTDSGVKAPTGLTLTAQGTAGIHLHWTDNSTAELAYEIEAKWSGSDQFSRIATLPANSTDYQLQDWPTQSLTFRVRAVAMGESAYSDNSTIGDHSADFTNIGNVTGLFLDGYDYAGAILKWTQNDYNGYQIVYRKLSDNPGAYSPWDLAQITPQPSTPPVPGPFMEDRLDWSYLAWPDGIQVAVRSQDPITGDWSVSNIITIGFGTADAPDPVATAPVLTSYLIDTVNGQYTFTYNAPASGITYTLFNAASAAGGSSAYVSPLSSTSTSTLFSDPNQSDGHFVILATDSSGNASISNVIDAGFAADPAANWSTGIPPLTTKLIADGKISLAWDNVSYNENGYDIQWSAVGGTNDSDWTTIDTVGADVTSYVDDSPTANATNYYRVVAARTQTVEENVMVGGVETEISAPLNSGWISAEVTTPPPLKLEILWEGPNIQGTQVDPATGLPETIHTGQDITGKTINYLAGQKISLAVTWAGGNLTQQLQAAGQSGTWDLGGGGPGHYDYVDGYTPTPSRIYDGKLITIPLADFSRPQISFYGVLDAPNHAFTATFGKYTASTTFNIQKPGYSIMNGEFSATINQEIPEYDAPSQTIRDKVTFTIVVPAGVNEPLNPLSTNAFVVQLGNLDIRRWKTPGKGIGSTMNTHGKFELDNFYPYPYDEDQPTSPFTKADIFLIV